MREKKCGECRNAPYFFVMQHTLAKLPDSRYNWNDEQWLWNWNRQERDNDNYSLCG